MHERTEQRRVRDASARSVIDAIEIDVRRGNRILEIAGEPEQRERSLAAVRPRTTQRGAALDLCDRLARVPLPIDQRRLIAVRAQLGERQRTGIVGPRVVSDAGHQGERPAVRQRQPEARVQDALVGSAVVALSLVIEPRDRERGAPACDRDRGGGLPLVPAPPRSLAEPPSHEPRVLAYALYALRCGPDADHAAGRVPEQRRGRAAQHLDTVHFAQLEVGELALAVGKGLRDSVDENLYPAHGERRAGAEAANRDALILR